MECSRAGYKQILRADDAEKTVRTFINLQFYYFQQFELMDDAGWMDSGRK